MKKNKKKTKNVCLARIKSIYDPLFFSLIEHKLYMKHTFDISLICIIRNSLGIKITDKIQRLKL